MKKMPIIAALAFGGVLLGAAAPASATTSDEEGQPIRVFGVFEKVPAKEDHNESQVFKIIGLPVPREQALAKMKEAA